jgi:SAM-dependent methyltransferase
MHKVESISDYQWLEKWSSHISGKKVLELGCGGGIDTRSIADLASAVVACDLKPGSEFSLTVQVLELDYSKPLPFKKEFDVVIASLSLHYFDWKTTEGIVAEVARVLVTGGILLCRVNSNEDINYGAQESPELEPGLLNVEGMPKRFFDKQSILQLFSGHWVLTELEHNSIDRYPKTKYVWEFGAVNA